MEESTIVISRIIQTVTEFKQTIKEYIEESSKRAGATVMDSLSIKITTSTKVNGRETIDTEKESSRKHQLEELKEDFMNIMEKKKSL